MSEPYKYFKKPTFFHVNEDGEIGMEWILADGNRFTIYVAPWDAHGEPLAVYYIWTTLETQECAQLTTNEEIKKKMIEKGIELS